VAKQAPGVKIRLPDRIKAAVAKAAKANFRSANAEIVAILAEHYGLSGDEDQGEEEDDYLEEPPPPDTGPAPDQRTLFDDLSQEDLEAIERAAAALKKVRR
jgi:hypothetical protein